MQYEMLIALIRQLQKETTDNAYNNDVVISILINMTDTMQRIKQLLQEL